ncbi:Uma2 family endonuclease [Micromonospora zamorensis]|uniref:Uma2 family endonuclease n=1 Tax=Micromonospora zamorensis TaxID=709883 RepID=UPI003CF1A27F
MGSLSLEHHIGLWTEADYFALGETPDRFELLDGSLLLSPVPCKRHQLVSRRLADHVERAADGLAVFGAVNVRLGVDRSSSRMWLSRTPTTRARRWRPPRWCSSARSSRPATPPPTGWSRCSWYLLVEQDGDGHSLRLFRLDGEHYVEDQVAKPGETLTVVEPFRWQLDPATLR